MQRSSSALWWCAKIGPIDEHDDDDSDDDEDDDANDGPGSQRWPVSMIALTMAITISGTAADLTRSALADSRFSLLR